jgi:hypothetical protein
MSRNWVRTLGPALLQPDLLIRVRFAPLRAKEAKQFGTEEAAFLLSLENN